MISVHRIADVRLNAAALLLAFYATAIALSDGALRWLLAGAVLLVPFFRWILLAPNAWLVAFFAAALLTPPFPVAPGNSGPHPAVMAAVLGALVGVLRLREWNFPRTFLTSVLAAFSVMLLFSAALAAIYSGAEIGAESLARAGLSAISVYVFFYVSAGPGRAGSLSPSSLYAAACASAAFACLDFFRPFPAPAGFGNQFVWLDSGVYRRAQGLFYEAGALGNFCAFGVVMTAVALLRGVGKRLVLLGGMCVFAAALILSYSRASGLNALVALGTLAFLERARFRRRGLAWAGAAVIGCAALIFAMISGHAAAYWTRLWFSATSLFSYPDRIFGGRLESWATLLRFLAANPWYAIFGVGYKTLPYSDFIGERVVADNMYLSMLVETGIVGLALLLAMNFAILRAGYRAARSIDREKSFYGAAIFCFWAGETVQMLSADVLTFWRLLPLYFWALAMAARG